MGNLIGQIKWTQGALIDASEDMPREAFVAIDESLNKVLDLAHEVQAERDALAERVELLRAALERAAVAIQSLRADNEAAS